MDGGLELKINSIIAYSGDAVAVESNLLQFAKLPLHSINCSELHFVSVIVNTLTEDVQLWAACIAGGGSQNKV